METFGLKIAFVGVSHWHVPLYLWEMPKGAVVAVSDPNREIAERFGRDLGCKAYTEYTELIETEKPDFVFAFAPHYQMKEVSLYLIGKHIPFTMEKPMGLCTSEVEEIKAEAEKNNTFAAIPFVWRYSDTVKRLKEELLSGKILHMSYRFVAGPPSRYLATSEWMLHREKAGGGCMTNLGVHFMDMALYLTDSDGAQVLASSYQYGPDYDVEIFGSSLLTLSSGASLVLETGYAYPMDEELKRENRWTIVTEKGYYILADNKLEAREFGKDTQVISLSTDSDVYYPIFAATTLEDYVKGRTPRASLPEMVKVRSILDEMNHKAGSEV